MEEPVLSVRDLTMSFKLRNGWFPAIRNVSFDLARNETLCIVGESGCGKSLTALSILRLISETVGHRIEGEVFFGGMDLLRLSDKEMLRVRGARIAMTFQEPMTSLNPVLSIGQQVAEPLVCHRGMSWGAAEVEALRLLDQVKIPSAQKRFREYPHQFSGGMRQRVMIAMALACQPDVLIADEPTTALDVTIQAQILLLLDDLRKQRQMSLILITHDMGVVASVGDRVAVMYGGEIVELARTGDLFARPIHPYSEALLRSIPRPDRDIDELESIPGQVPAIDRMPDGCRFAPRCDARVPRCEQQVPRLTQIANGSKTLVRCWVRGPRDIEAGNRAP